MAVTAVLTARPGNVGSPISDDTVELTSGRRAELDWGVTLNVPLEAGGRPAKQGSGHPPA